MIIDQSDIVSKLISILNDKFKVDFSDRWKEVKDKPLLGYSIKMRPRHLVYLFFEIEKVFGITISQEHIIDGKFNTFENIVGIILDELKSKKTLHAAG